MSGLARAFGVPRLVVLGHDHDAAAHRRHASTFAATLPLRTVALRRWSRRASRCGRGGDPLSRLPVTRVIATGSRPNPARSASTHSSRG